MSLDETKLQEYAETLYDAWASKTPVEPLSNDTAFNTADAYEIQSRVVDRILADGDEIAGHKLGLVSAAKQEQLGIDEPIFGYFTEGGVLDEPVVQTEELIAPRLEAEIGLVLDEDVPAPASVTDVLSATGAVVPVVEILESRFAGWEIPSAQDVIADNTSAGKVVVGETHSTVTDVDLRMESVVVSKNGEVVSSGTGADIMGNPARAVAWLGDRLDDLDDRLEAGELVMTGGITAADDMAPGDIYHVEFGSIGSIDVRAE